MLHKFIKMFDFDEYMRPFLVMFAVGYIIGIFKFAYLLIKSFKGLLFYLVFMPSLLIFMLIFLRIYQSICRFMGANKLYNNIKNKVKK